MTATVAANVCPVHRKSASRDHAAGSRLTAFLAALVREEQSMVKKFILVGSAALVLVGVLFGREGYSHIKTSLGWVRQSVRESVPVEFEISRARKMTKDRGPKTPRNMHLIGRGEVEVKHRREQFGGGDKQLEKNLPDIKRLTRDVKPGDRHFVYCG